MKVEFFKHNIDEDDIKNTTDVLRSVFLTTGKVVDDFEEKFAAYLGSQYAVGVTSCTAALHLCLLAHEIGSGDEVITTPMSFCATANAILHSGAKPVFVDVEPETGNINAGLIDKAITERTRAIIPVHLYGQMSDTRQIRDIADRHKLVVIEDAAHAIEAERDSVRPGQLSEAVCFSFYATKNITCGEGGAITTNDRKKADELKKLRLHGMDVSAHDRYSGLYRHWDMPILGWKYNMSNIQAAVMMGQLDRIDELWKQRDYLWKLYEENLTDIPGIKLFKTVPNSKHARHMFTVLVDPGKRDNTLHDLQKRGVGAAVNYRAIHLLKYYRDKFGYKDGDFPVAEGIGEQTISLPLYPKLKKEAVVYVTENLKKIIRPSNLSK